MPVSRFGRRVVGMDLVVVLLVVLIVLALVGSVAVSPLLWALVVILVLFAVLGRGRYYGRRGGWLWSDPVDRGDDLARPSAFGLTIYIFGLVRRH